MFIITTDQVTYNQGIRRYPSQIEYVSIFVYQKQLFVKGDSYSYQERHTAIAQAQRNLISGIISLIVIDDHDNYLICYQDQNLELLPEKSLPNLETIVNAIRNHSGLIKNNQYKLRTYPRSIIGTELVDWLCDHFHCSREQAVEIGQSLINHRWLHHTWDDHNFKDEPLLYRFYQDESITLPLIAK
ncbi:hypothetical protein FRE64_08435 [Euhalothece natronophila Z-M001]|uniref:DEP domain-containing protein n=1 Tax=Euhalothece natronophila Z-M001 TaxID=522448 RepID=A0A5B8NP46_9CHRO|nr:DEP domain-containing protein [Euhalothece natronophila]QDZ39965.1 hypothetical protein FRE64_08435 [Euhalothece natronophila Z-M001]